MRASRRISWPARLPDAVTPAMHPPSHPQGYLLITPLRQAGGGGRCVMVHRGWVPTEWRESAELRATGEPAGVVGGAGGERAQVAAAPSAHVPAPPPAGLSRLQTPCLPPRPQP